METVITKQSRLQKTNTISSDTSEIDWIPMERHEYDDSMNQEWPDIGINLNRVFSCNRPSDRFDNPTHFISTPDGWVFADNGKWAEEIEFKIRQLELPIEKRVRWIERTGL